MTDTVIVVGGAGFIGSHVCKALDRNGFRPVVFDDLRTGHRDAVRWGPFEQGDIADAARFADVLRTYRPRAVVHLAGYIAAGESVADPGKYYGNNIGGALSLIAAMRETGLSRIVFSSSAAVYGDPETLPIDETAPIRPVSPYGHTKAMTERMLCDHAAVGIASVSLRYFNAAGADPEGELGERHQPETHLIPLVLDTAAGNRPAIDIYGTDHPTSDGTCIRDYIHVSDLAQAHVAALRRLEGCDGALAYNLGNGAGFSVRDVIAAAERVTGRPVPTRARQARPGDPPALVADASRAMRELGWRQRHGDLDVQISHAWHWRRRQAMPPDRGAGVAPTMPRSGHAALPAAAASIK